MKNNELQALALDATARKKLVENILRGKKDKCFPLILAGYSSIDTLLHEPEALALDWLARQAADWKKGNPEWMDSLMQTAQGLLEEVVRTPMPGRKEAHNLLWARIKALVEHSKTGLEIGFLIKLLDEPLLPIQDEIGLYLLRAKIELDGQDEDYVLNWSKQLNKPHLAVVKIHVLYKSNPKEAVWSVIPLNDIDPAAKDALYPFALAYLTQAIYYLLEEFGDENGFSELARVKGTCSSEWLKSLFDQCFEHPALQDKQALFRQYETPIEQIHSKIEAFNSNI